MPDWIPVHDRLPETVGDALVCQISGKYRFVRKAMYTPPNPFKHTNSAGEYFLPAGWYEPYSDDGYPEYLPVEVTHWMPIPELPPLPTEGE